MLNKEKSESKKGAWKLKNGIAKMNSGTLFGLETSENADFLV